MSSRVYGSEVSLAVLGCRRAQTLAAPCVLVGGLGMGFTLRSALDLLPPTATVVVSELLPAVVDWNRGPLGALTHYPLNDPRVTVEIADIAALLRSSPARFDAILLDVDNGPSAFTSPANARLYGAPGLASFRAALDRGRRARRLVRRRRPSFPAAPARRRVHGGRRTRPRTGGERRPQAHRLPRSARSRVKAQDLAR